MTAPRRYRAALLAYPRGYRATRGPELLATLADGDEERGNPSSHEAAALAYRGLVMRARVAVEPEGLLVAAAVVVLLALMGNFTWATHVFLDQGEPGAMLVEGGPGKWAGLALAVAAFSVIAAGPFRAQTPSAAAGLPAWSRSCVRSTHSGCSRSCSTSEC
jgi:hypothetical protein